MNLEYFISSLPMILEDQPAKIAPEAFEAQCAEQLSPALAGAARAVAALAGNGGPASGGDVAALLDSPGGHPFVREFADREIQLRNAVAAERARRRGDSRRPAPRAAGGCDASIAQGVAAAFSEKDPLSRERALDSIRWRVLDELQGFAPFSEAAVLAYAGKLALNSRRFAADEEKGMERFKAMTSGGQAGNSEN